MAVSKPSRAALRDFVAGGVLPAPGDAAGGQALLAEAGRQGLTALLAGVPGFLSTLPEEQREPWRAAARTQLVRGALQLDLAARVLGRLQESRRRALPLKGAAVAEGLYDAIGDRAMADVDVLVLDDPASAVLVLAGDGFAVLERADHAVALRDPRSAAVVELHRSITSCPGLFPVEGEGLWSRREVLKGLVSVAPGPEDLLVSLSLHAAFQHGFGLSLVQFLDFRRLLERRAIDLAVLLEAARASRAEGAVLLSLAAARAVVGAPVPQALLAALETRVPEALARRARTLAEADPLALVGPARPSLSAARLALAPGRRLALLAATLAPAGWPGEARPGRLRAASAGARRALRLLAGEVGRWRAAGLQPAAEER